MSGALGSKPKEVKPGPVPIIPPIPTVDEEVGDEAKKSRPRGRRETFLTGDLVPTDDKKKKKLG